MTYAFAEEYEKNLIDPKTNKPLPEYETAFKKYAEEAVYEHMSNLQKEFFKEQKGRKKAPYAWNMSDEEFNKKIKEKYFSLPKDSFHDRNYSFPNRHLVSY